MYTFNFITVGPLKEEYRRKERDEYAKRLGAYGKVVKTELSAYKLPSEPSDAEIESALSKEGETILRAIPKGAHVIALCVEGKKMDSPSFASYLGRVADSGTSDICFIIGSSYGLSPAVKKAAHMRLSVSDFTFPHSMMQPILYEIVYRSMNILRGGKYHK